MRKIAAVFLAVMCLAGAGGESSAPPAAGKEDATAEPKPGVERTKDKGGRITEVVRDRRGNVIIRRTNVGTPKEATWLYTYSQTDQLLSEQAPDGTRTLYDYEGPESKKPRRVKVIGPDGKETERTKAY